jgi:hypothetical protein
MQYTGIKSIDEKINEKIVNAQTKKYFITRKLRDCNKLIPKVEDIVKEYKNSLKPWYKSNWKEAEQLAWENAIHTSIEVGRFDILNYICDRAREISEEAAWKQTLDIVFEATYDFYNACEIAKNVAKHASMYVALDAGWEVIRDIKGYENNPFEKFVKIYDLGLYPIGFSLVDGVEKFVVDFPLNTLELGWWKEGDKKILYVHKWDSNDLKIISKRKILKKILKIIFYGQ